MHCWRSRQLHGRFLWRLECRVELLRLWSTRDQLSNTAWLEKKAKKPFTSVNNVFALRKPTFIFEYHPNLCKENGSLQFRAWICIIFHGQNFYDFQRSKLFSRLHLLYLYPLSKQSFPNYSQNTRHSSLRISPFILVSQTASKQVLLHSFHLRLPVELDIKYATCY